MPRRKGRGAKQESNNGEFVTNEELLESENKLLRATIEILSKDNAALHQRSMGSAYVEARAERIAQSISTAIAQFEHFKRLIVDLLYEKQEKRRKKAAALRKKKAASKKQGTRRKKGK